MADKELPKDYSRVYCEETIKPPRPPKRRIIGLNGCPVMPITNRNDATNNHYEHQNQVHRKQAIWSDGAAANKRHCESSIDIRAYLANMQNLPRENHQAYAMETLKKHYSTVFASRRKSSTCKADKAGFKAYIQYFNEKDTYVVRVETNTLQAVKDKLPKQGRYRYFFKHSDSTCEEVELDGSQVPFYEKEGSKQIYCQIFSY